MDDYEKEESEDYENEPGLVNKAESGNKNYTELLKDFQKLSKHNLKLEDRIERLREENETLITNQAEKESQLALVQNQMTILRDKYKYQNHDKGTIDSIGSSIQAGEQTNTLN